MSRPEGRIAEAMRLAAARLVEHSDAEHKTAARLEQPSGYGAHVDAQRRDLADAHRREGNIDFHRAKTLKTLIRKGKV